MKVKDIFNLNNDFKGFKLLAGEGGLNKEVKDVEILEVPDGVYWTKEGDLAITTAYFLYKENSDLTSWIETLNEKGAAGLGIKTDRFLKKISAKAIKKANELNFPLFEIPIHIGYSDMTWPIISKILGESEFTNFRLEKFNDELISLSSNHYSLKDIFNIMKKHIKNPFVVFSSNKKIECILNNQKVLPIANIITLLNERKNTIDTSVDFICLEYAYKVFVKALKTEGEVIGYLFIIINKDNHQNLDLKIASLSCPYLIVGIILEKSHDYLRYDSKESFLKAIIDNEVSNRMKLKRDAAYYNIAYDLKRVIWIIEIESKHELEVNFNNIRDLIKSKLDSVEIHIIHDNNSVICINNLNEKMYRKIWFQHLLKELEYKFPGCSFKIGVSKTFDSLDKLSIAYDEARFSLEKGSKIEGENIQLFDDLIIYYILNEVLNNPQIIRIYEDTIKKLKDYDVNNGTELIGTLSCYIENNYNVLKTAEY